MNRKQIISLAASLLFAVSANASVNLNGSSLKDATTLADGQVGVYLVSTDGTSFTGGALSSLASDISIFDSGTYGAFEYVGFNTAAFGFGSTTLGGLTGIDLAGAADPGDAFAVLVFNTSTTTTVTADTYQIWTDVSWVLPTDGGTFTFDTDIAQLTGASSASGSVVPEPSTYAALAGLCALGYVMVRRRRA